MTRRSSCRRRPLWILLSADHCSPSWESRPSESPQWQPVAERRRGPSGIRAAYPRTPHREADSISPRRRGGDSEASTISLNLLEVISDFGPRWRKKKKTQTRPRWKPSRRRGGVQSVEPIPTHTMTLCSIIDSLINQSIDRPS